MTTRQLRSEARRLTDQRVCFVCRGPVGDRCEFFADVGIRAHEGACGDVVFSLIKSNSPAEVRATLASAWLPRIQ
jgi:hypothetical protein